MTGGNEERRHTLALVNREGSVTVLDVPPAAYVSPRLSPDGKRLAVQTDDEDGSVLWIYDLSGDSAMRRLTFEGNNTRPLWTPDGERITFASDRDGANGIYWKPADGSGVAERLTMAEGGGSHDPDAWYPDGRTLIFTSESESHRELWRLSLDSRSPELLVGGPLDPLGGGLSPDGKWLAYSREFQIFVEPFPPTGAGYRITRNEGVSPVWSRDGSQLFFRRPSTLGTLLTVDVTTEPEFRFSEERALPVQGFRVVLGHRSYDPTPDVEKFLVVLPAAEAATGEAPAPTSKSSSTGRKS